ncbi:MAG: glycosyltransferase family 1 protein [Nitrospirae bacterium]|nr:MAG: glycosyltransferase family 1 protein [Nitrospirota bacterium]
MASAAAETPPLRLGVAVRRFHPYGGGERFLARLLEALPAERFEVHLFTTGRPPAGPWRHHRVAAPEWAPWGRFWGYAWAVGRAVARHPVDLLYAHDPVLAAPDLFRAGGGCHPAFLAAMARAAGPARRLWERLRPRHRVMAAVERRCFRAARRVVVNSERVAAEAERHYGVPRSRITVLYNGIDPDRFREADRAAARAAYGERFPAAADRVRLLYVGSGFRRKGVDLLLRALARTPHRGRYHLAVVGKEPRAGRYRRLARRLGIGPQVDFTGPLAEVDRLYLGADCFCFPTRYEPFSNACLEAMAAGLPLVTTAANGVAELLTEGGGRVVQEPEAVAELAAALAAASDPAWRAEQGARAREVAARHTLEGYQAAWTRLLLALAEGRP